MYDGAPCCRNWSISRLLAAKDIQVLRWHADLMHCNTIEKVPKIVN